MVDVFEYGIVQLIVRTIPALYIGIHVSYFEYISC